MKFACVGGDRRQIETALRLKNLGHNVSISGLPAVSSFYDLGNLSKISEFDAVILPIPVTKDGRTINTPLTNDIIFIHDLLEKHPKRVFGGMIKQKLIEELDSHNIKYHDYYKSEALTVKNAVLTAEAAIAIAINCTDFAIFGSKALVIGYGRIGRQLAKYLKSLGASVIASSRDAGRRAIIETDGITAIDSAECYTVASECDYVFNTAPSPIMNSCFFENCKKSAFVEDLATDAGTDFAAASRFGINAALYSSLPGKHSPITAASYIAREILENINSNNTSHGG